VVPLVPARLAFDPGGVPYSEAYGDVYHSADGGPAQARAVFLAGNTLPARWRGRTSFTIVETGFGLGLNFLVTCAAFLADERAPRRMHYVSVEKHPFSKRDLAAALARYPDLPLSSELVAAWPLGLPGFHRLHLARGRVTLTLLLGDAQELLLQLEARVDAFYLDGFAPERNPEMWSPAIAKELGRLAAPGATIATWSVAGSVRAALDRRDSPWRSARASAASARCWPARFRSGRSTPRRPIGASPSSVPGSQARAAPSGSRRAAGR
jgi:tRNA 5-methylaminomethyl-2-thiouridine biosynthesis bifunctional protein